MNLNRITFFQIFIVLILAPHLIETSSSISYSKSWKGFTGSELKFTISPTTAYYKPNRNYDYFINLEAVEFTSTLDRFTQIEVTLRFFNAIKTIQSETKRYYELIKEGAQVNINISLEIPSADIFSLNEGEKLEGELQYKIECKESLINTSEYDITTNWDTISTGRITNPFPSSSIFLQLCVIVIILIIILTIIYLFIKKKELIITHIRTLIEQLSIFDRLRHLNRRFSLIIILSVILLYFMLQEIGVILSHTSTSESIVVQDRSRKRGLYFVIKVNIYTTEDKFVISDLKFQYGYEGGTFAVIPGDVTIGDPIPKNIIEGDWWGAEKTFSCQCNVSISNQISTHFLNISVKGWHDPNKQIIYPFDEYKLEVSLKGSFINNTDYFFEIEDVNNHLECADIQKYGHPTKISSTSSRITLFLTRSKFERILFHAYLFILSILSYIFFIIPNPIFNWSPSVKFGFLLTILFVPMALIFPSSQFSLVITYFVFYTILFLSLTILNWFTMQTPPPQWVNRSISDNITIIDILARLKYLILIIFFLSIYFWNKIIKDQFNIIEKFIHPLWSFFSLGFVIPVIFLLIKEQV